MHRGRRRLRNPPRNIKQTRYVRCRVTSEQFRDARVFSGMDRDEAADFLGVSVRTVGHWETGKSKPSYAAFKMLRVYRHGDLVDPRWSAYKLVRGRLVTPEGHAFYPGDMAWLSLLVRRAAAFSELRKEKDAAVTAGPRRERDRGASAWGAGGMAASIGPAQAGADTVPGRLARWTPLVVALGAAGLGCFPAFFQRGQFRLSLLPSSNRGVTRFRVDGLTTDRIHSCEFSPVEPVKCPSSNTGQKLTRSAHLGGISGQRSECSSSRRSQGRGGSLRGITGDQPQRFGRGSASRLSRRSQASPDLGSGREPDSGSVTAVSPRKPASNSVAPRRPQRSVPVRQWQESQGLSPALMLTPGGQA